MIGERPEAMGTEGGADRKKAEDRTELQPVEHRRHDGGRPQNDQGILEDDDFGRSGHRRQHRL